MNKKQNGDVNINNSSVKVQGDIVGRDKTTTINAAHTEFTESIFVREKRMKTKLRI